MHLALRRARADRAPAHEVGGVLRSDRIEELASRWQAEPGDVEQQLPREMQPLVDCEGAVEMRIVDQPLPSHRGARFLEIHAHDDQEVVRQLSRERVQMPGVLERGSGVVYRARPHDDEETLVLEVEHPLHLEAAPRHDARALLVERQLFEQDRGREQRTDGLDVEVACPHAIEVYDRVSSKRVGAVMPNSSNDRLESESTSIGSVPLHPYRGKTPMVAPDAWVAPSADLIGDVTLEAGASVWFNVTIRADMAPVRIGERSNVQDNCVIHTDVGEPTILGRDVTLGHGAIVHSSVVGDNVLIGMGAVLVGGCRIGDGTIVGAGAVLPSGMEVPPHKLVV